MPDLGPFNQAGLHSIAIQAAGGGLVHPGITFMDYADGSILKARLHLPTGSNYGSTLWLTEVVFPSQAAAHQAAQTNPLLMVDCPDLPLRVDGTEYDPYLAAMVLFKNKDEDMQLIRFCPHPPPEVPVPPPPPPTYAHMKASQGVCHGDLASMGYMVI